MNDVTLYDQLMKVRDNPELFEEKANQIINDFINQLPTDRARRAKGHQFRIEMQLSRYKDPIARMNKMVELFWDGVNQFNETINNYKQPDNSEKQIAEVIQFNS